MCQFPLLHVRKIGYRDLPDSVCICYNKSMKNTEKKDRQHRNRVLAIKVTAEEKKKITDYAAQQCVNVSALVRQLLFDRLKKTSHQ
jgi:hypothetical protein